MKTDAPYKKAICNFLLITSITLSSSLFYSCKKNNNSEVNRYDTSYYMGLQKLAEGKENEARVRFSQAAKKASYYCARESAIMLTELGTIQEKNKACTELIERFDDADTRLIAAKQFFASEEVGRVLDLTSDIDYEKDNNELIKIRLECLNERKISTYYEEVFKWFTSRSVSDYHYRFFRDVYSKDLDLSEEGVLKLSPEDFIILCRIDLYKRNYISVFNKASTILEYFKQQKIDLLPQITSDMGKGFLYGSNEFVSNAKLCCEEAEVFKGSPLEYYFWFYAGRLFDRAGLYYKQSITCFENAINCCSGKADENHKKDNAIWYLLNTTLNASVDTTINKLSLYSQQWEDPKYFEDFFEKLIPAMLEKGSWNAFETLLKIVNQRATKAVTAKVAYIYGRLLQNGFALAENKTEEIRRAFRLAVDSGDEPYYKIMAAYQLGISRKDLDSILLAYNSEESSLEKQEALASEKIDLKAAESFLRGYVTYGFPQKIFPAWQKLKKEGISTETAMYLSDFLYKCGATNDNYKVQSIRIAAEAGKKAERELTKEELKLIYPKNFNSFIEGCAEKYSIDSSVIYALVRTESFFSPEVISNAGAVGLTQLMEFTAGDIARKLKVQNYSLTDAETNIEFGSYYLAELVRRCDYSYLQALLSYNAGITRVRRWLSSSMLEFGKKQDMSNDLFLETVPYEETRNYGKKLLAATVIYEYLYSDYNDFFETVEKFLK